VRKQPLFEKSGAKTFFILEPGVGNAVGLDSKKSFCFFFYPMPIPPTTIAL
jgi:hypothetical protein